MKHKKVYELVERAYLDCIEPFGQWVWKNHVPIVVARTEELAKIHGANEDLAVAGALLHDFGDAFIYRHAEAHEEISMQKATEVLKEADYSEIEISRILNEVIKPHSCRNGHLPESLEGKVMATADALAHLTTDFYVQFTWLHIPENKTYDEFLEWVTEKLDRDFHKRFSLTM